ncbi:MAG: histidine kinase [Puia sp.]
MEIQEQTFDMISQEIHDNVGQILSLAKVQLSIMEQKQSVEGELLTNVKESISLAMTELRDIAKRSE